VERTSEVPLELELLVQGLHIHSQNLHNCLRCYIAELAWRISRKLALPSVDRALELKIAAKLVRVVVLTGLAMKTFFSWNMTL
jgi:hypothetical protein